MLIVTAALLLAVVLGAARWFISGDIQMLVKLARYGLMAMALVALGLLFISGRLSAFFIGVLACLPLLGSFQALWEETRQRLDKASHNQRSGSMDRAMALTILGIPPDASHDEIKATHKKLIQKLHPDKGGSAYLAQEVNQARDILLG